MFKNFSLKNILIKIHSWQLKSKFYYYQGRVWYAGYDHTKLHLGSGKVILPGWFNIDNDARFGRAHQVDLRKKLPFPNESVSIIFSEHLIEHLPKQQGLQLLKECYRVLKKGGKIRFGWPNFSKDLEAYLKKNQKFRKAMQKHMGPNLTGSWDEFFFDLLYSWDHRYMYTPELLKAYFKLAGFNKLIINRYNQSQLGFKWDTRDDFDTTYIESKK